MKNPFSRKYIFLLFPLIMVLALDLAFTLIGQSQDYWRNFQFFNEANPLAAILLSWHPAFFIISFLFYLAIIMFLIVNLNGLIGTMLYLFFFLIHSWGSSSWLSELLFSYQADYMTDWYLRIGYFLFISVISGISLNIWDKNRSK